MRKFILEIQLLRNLQIEFEQNSNHENTLALVKQEIIIDELLSALLYIIDSPDKELRDLLNTCSN